MVKCRPVLVLAGAFQGRGDLVTIVALSTTPPDPIKPFHLILPRACLPQLGQYQGTADTWVKGDMVYTVGFHRLDAIKLGKRNPQTGKREYFNQRLGRERMREVYACVLNGLNLSHVAQYV